jgi:hypothetical protein
MDTANILWPKIDMENNMRSVWIVHTNSFSLAMEEKIIAICDDEQLAVDTMHRAIEEDDLNPDDVWVDHFYLMVRA